MRCVVQRVLKAGVSVEGKLAGAVGKGLMVLVGVMDGDTDKDVQYMADKVPNLRIFEDGEGKMNLSVKDVGGAILAVSQFTLSGDARGGRRPSFIRAAKPDAALPLYQRLVAAWRGQGVNVETGVFRAHMEVTLTNDGPVTILLDSEKTF